LACSSVSSLHVKDSMGPLAEVTIVISIIHATYMIPRGVEAYSS